MKRSLYIRITISLLMVCCMLVTVMCPCGTVRTSAASDPDMMSDEEMLQDDSDEAETADAEPQARVKLIAVGDNLIHDNIIKSGLQKDGTYDYSELFANIKDYIADADIRIINQETVFINDSAEYSGYPRFGTPTAMGDAMAAAGFNVITLATNHSYDKQKQGVVDTVNFWKKYKDTVLTVGMYKTQKAYDKIAYREYNGIRIAFLNYTFVMNGSGNKLDKDQYYIKKSGWGLMKREIKEAKQNADFVIVLPHWGKEYVNTPNATQEEYAQHFADWGADLIIGCHPHVVQPVRIITSKDGREVPCYYSLGNYVSNMLEVPKVLGSMAEVTIARYEDGVRVETYDMSPLICHISRNDDAFTVYRLADYTDELIKKTYFYRKGKKDYTIEWFTDHYQSIIDETLK